ncbi:MAG: cytochrome P460 family protein [Candidatus Binatia bacterium]
MFFASVLFARPFRCAIFTVALALLAAAAMPASARACAGDCNGDRKVDIGELIRGVAIALDNADLSQCPAMDGNRTGSVSIGELIEAVNAALLGCPEETPTPQPTPTPTGGVEPILPANYRETFVEVRGCRFSTEHDFRNIRVLTNPIAAEPYRRNQNPLPEGSIVVKEEFASSEGCNDADLIVWRVMRKEAPGFDSEDADWHWQWIDAPSRHVQFDDKATCISCHKQQECLERDYMCTVAAHGDLNPVAEDVPGALLSIAGTGPTDVYAVGADPGDGKGPMVLRYNGADWQRLETGASGHLWWISTTPIGGDFYMSGAGGLILQYDPEGGGFTRHTTPGTETLFGIWGAAANDIWAVGGTEENPDTSGTIWRYDGTQWTRQDLTAVREGGVPRLFKVWGRAANDVYAVGGRGVVLHFDGNTWTALDSAPRSLFTVHGNDTHTVAVGGFGDNGLVIERQGAGAFTDRTPSRLPQANGVFVPADGRAVAVGNFLSTAVRDAGIWSLVDRNDEEARDYHAVWVDSEDGIWAVGGDLAFDLTDGVISYGGPRQVSGTVR